MARCFRALRLAHESLTLFVPYSISPHSLIARSGNFE